MRDGKRHGQGIETFADGARKEGEWRDGKKHGRGTHTWADGDRHEGEWQEGKFHEGIWTNYHLFSRPSRYEGEWDDGAFHGQGTLTVKVLDGGWTLVGEWNHALFWTGTATIDYTDSSGNRFHYMWTCLNGEEVQDSAPGGPAGRMVSCFSTVSMQTPRFPFGLRLMRNTRNGFMKKET